MDGSSQIGRVTRYSRGTESYRAPELLFGTEYTNKVDLWVLGCILFELVFRKKAFNSDYAAMRYAESGNEFQVPFEADIFPDERRRQFVTQVLRELFRIEAKQRPSARSLYERFVGWGSNDLSTLGDGNLSQNRTPESLESPLETTQTGDLTIIHRSVNMPQHPAAIVPLSARDDQPEAGSGVNWGENRDLYVGNLYVIASFMTPRFRLTS